jgi:hypothetical protein
VDTPRPSPRTNRTRRVPLAGAGTAGSPPRPPTKPLRGAARPRPQPGRRAAVFPLGAGHAVHARVAGAGRPMAPRARAPLRISCTFTRPEGAPGRAKRPLVQPHLTRTGASHTYRRISHIRGRCILALLARAPRRRGRSAGRVPRILTSLGPLTAAYAHLSLRASRVPLRRKLPLGLAVGPVGVIDQLVERLAGVGARLRPSGHAPWSTRGGAPRLRAGACARGRRGSTRRCRAARGAGGANHSAPPHPPLHLVPHPRDLGGGGRTIVLRATGLPRVAPPEPGCCGT